MIMSDVDLRDFWHRFQTGIAVAVADSSPDKLLGVRDGFVRYFRQGLDRQVSVAVVPQEGEPAPFGLPISDEEVLERLHHRALELQQRLGDAYHFYVASDGGLHSLEIDGRMLYFVRNWTLILGRIGEALGASGSVQLPEQLLGGLEGGAPLAVPGTRRKGGLISSLTGGLENRRKATASSTVHALSTLFYGVFERRSGAPTPA
jgi:non-canonical (house-cleaning) NTP pyrophosphatase